MNWTDNFVLLWAGITTLGVIRYVVIAGLVALVLLVWFRRWSDRRRIQQKRASASDIRREILFSLITKLIFGVAGALLFKGGQAGLFKIYTDVDRFGWFYLIASVPLIFVLHDAYFYWTHRAMHHPGLFGFFHRLHHRSRVPTPWASFSFAPAEAVVMVMFIPIYTLLIPLHLSVFAIFLFLMVLRNAQGHSGIEFHPRWWIDSPCNCFTTVTHHDLHHQRFNGNYGLYFTWWDRWMGTEIPDYKQQFLSVVAGTQSADRTEAENTASTSL